MSFIDEQTKQDVRSAIKALEKETAGEMVCVIAPASANYRMFAVLWAALAALAAPALNGVLHYLPGMGDWAPFEVDQTMQLCIFVFLLAIFALTPLRVCLTPRDAQACCFSSRWRSAMSRSWVIRASTRKSTLPNGAR